MFRNDRRVEHRIIGIERYSLDDINESRVTKIARAHVPHQVDQVP